LDRALPGGHKSMDAALFLLRHGDDRVAARGREEGASGPSLMAVSPTQYKKDPAIRAHLEAGTYSVVPFTTGCKLRKRAAQPARAVALIKPDGNGGYELTPECRRALTQVFHRLDADGRGSVSREEYSYLQMRTDGEPCDDETWE